MRTKQEIQAEIAKLQLELETVIREERSKAKDLSKLVGYYEIFQHIDNENIYANNHISVFKYLTLTDNYLVAQIININVDEHSIDSWEQNCYTVENPLESTPELDRMWNKLNNYLTTHQYNLEQFVNELTNYAKDKGTN